MEKEVEKTGTEIRTFTSLKDLNRIFSKPNSSVPSII